ncbi:tyrosine-type recombinase/integrase [Brachybacterium muris]|uniref:Integrase n=1 Tax=Brachybacterium muris UCD-AY4 TaxID=1249481 RepID=A0A022L3D0_9MICO|nr:site-specific integrase [Brachybacterium muris]EYT50515.1 integrase [Brachybacterium muris UCD-AY4]
MSRTRAAANGEGSIYKRADGKWVAALVVEDPETGKRRRRVLYGKTRTEARHKLREAQDRADDGLPITDKRAELGGWIDRWVTTTLEASDRKQSTKDLYATVARRYIATDPIAHRTLDRLKPSDVEAFLLRMRNTPKDPESEDADPIPKYSSSTIRTTYTVLRAIRDGAKRDGLIARNPVEAVKRPAVERVEARYLTIPEARALMHASKGSRYHHAVVLIAHTGLRRGEALALRWDDVDLDTDNPAIRVRGTLARSRGRLTVTTPKTTQSIRTVPLAPDAVDALRAQRTAQKRDRLRAANIWTDTGYVFTTATGEPVDPRNLYRVVQVAATAAGLEHVGVHALRHTAATLMLEGGVNIKAVSALLGHSSVAITGDVYAHVTDDTARAAMATLGGALGERTA